jgi:hypothetical protein
MATVNFSHPTIGSLSIDTGIDAASWAYGLNTQNYPTYGGEVIQILSVYIDDLTLMGTVSTYAQLEAIFQYFVKYMSIATQGTNSNATQNGLSSYNLDPVVFTYGERNWSFKLYPLSAPGFTYNLETSAPQWQIQAHVVDDSPDLSIIQDGIKGAAITAINDGTLQVSSTYANEFNVTIKGSIIPNENTSFGLSGNLSPNYSDPNTDPFQVADATANQIGSDVSSLADYYSSLLGSYTTGGFQSLLTSIGSQPVVTPSTSGQGLNSQVTVKVPKATPSTTNIITKRVPGA